MGNSAEVIGEESDVGYLFFFGGVAKWTKATVCKTVIHGFESHRRLLFYPRR